jgi:Lrp/AsnC family transcriptional regulator for asnA, asnC and gidA
MTRQLDKLDGRILEYLHDDVRISNRKIASALDITEGTVRSRIGRMQEDGLVRFTATLDAGLLLQPISGFIGINVAGESVDAASKALAALPELNFVAKMLGRYDIFCSFLLRNNEELADLLQIKIPTIPGIKSSESTRVIQVFKFDRRWSVLGL